MRGACVGHTKTAAHADRASSSSYNRLPLTPSHVTSRRRSDTILSSRSMSLIDLISRSAQNFFAGNIASKKNRSETLRDLQVSRIAAHASEDSPHDSQHH